MILPTITPGSPESTPSGRRSFYVYNTFIGSFIMLSAVAGTWVASHAKSVGAPDRFAGLRVDAYNRYRVYTGHQPGHEPDGSERVVRVGCGTRKQIE